MLRDNITAMGAATMLFWLQSGNVLQRYRAALVITGIVTFIAPITPFDDAYRYADWCPVR